MRNQEVGGSSPSAGTNANGKANADSKKFNAAA